jgi:hypothetical protein
MDSMSCASFEEEEEGIVVVVVVVIIIIIGCVRVVRVRVPGAEKK